MGFRKATSCDDEHTAETTAGWGHVLRLRGERAIIRSNTTGDSYLSMNPRRVCSNGNFLRLPVGLPSGFFIPACSIHFGSVRRLRFRRLIVKCCFFRHGSLGCQRQHPCDLSAAFEVFCDVYFFLHIRSCKKNSIPWLRYKRPARASEYPSIRP